MWLSTFTTQRGNICVRFGSRALNIQACAMGKPLVDLLRRYPVASGVAGILIPFLVQAYMASREPKE